MKHIFILNPIAGKGTASIKLLPEIMKSVKELGVEYEIHRTINSGDAKRYVKERSTESPKEKLRFYACGGDGTASEVLNGLIGAENAELAVIPSGTGNDFVRNFPNKKDFLDIKKQIRGTARSIDAIRYELLEASGNEEIPTVGYALNMYNMGFDAQVVAKADEIKDNPIFSGSMAYIGGVAIVLRKLQKIDITIEADGAEIGSGQYLLAGVANGRFSGGGFDGMPVALVDDGFMDLLLVKSISRTFFLSIVKKYHDGTHLGDPKLNGILYNYKCKEAIFRPKEKMILAIDGETAIVGAIKFNVMAGAVNLSVPE